MNDRVVSHVTDQLALVEIAEVLEFLDNFFADGDAAELGDQLAAFTAGGYQLDELRADLQQLAGWARGEGRQ